MSNVPTWRRKLSNIQYLYQTYQLAILTGRIVHNTAGKYKDTYGAIMIHNCERAMYHGRVANEIKIVNIQTYDTRYTELKKMKANIDNVATYAFIWFEEIRNFDGANQKIISKTYKWENQIGDLADLIISLIDGVIRYDTRALKETINQTEAVV